MVKQIKKITMLLFVAATMFSFASCNKDNTEDTPSGGGGGSSSANYPETIVSTNWNWESSEPTNGFVRVGVFFGENNNFTSVTMEKAETHLADIYIGTYSYSTGSGSMSLEDQGSHTTTSATFSINGTTMTFKINGGTYTLTKQ